MKRKLSLLLVLCMMCTLVAGINVYAANYTLGNVLDFDKTMLTNTLPDGVHVQEDGYYGNVLNWDTRAAVVDIDFTNAETTEKLTSGKWIMSFDAKNAETTDKIVFYMLDYDESEQNFSQKWAFEQRLGNLVFTPNSGTNYVAINGTTWTAGNWTRYDLVFDYDNDTATVYMNGIQGGSFSIAADNYDSENVSNSSIKIDGFNKIRIQGTTHDANGDIDSSFDNFIYRPYPDTNFGAEISGSDDSLVIKFSETTTTLSADNFVITKKANPLSAAENVTGYSVSESCSAYTVIKLPEKMSAGERYYVELKNIASPFGNTPSPGVLEYVYTETEITTHTDDMSAYTTENMWSSGVWKTTTTTNSTQTATGYTTAADGVVTLSGADDGQKLLRYDVSGLDLSEGIIEIEANISVEHSFELPDGENASKAMTYFRFQDQRNEGFTIGEFQLNGLMVPFANQSAPTTVATKKDNALAFGAEKYNKVKIVFDMNTKLASMYFNDLALVENVYPWKSTSILAEDITQIPIISFTTADKYTISENTIPCNAKINIDSINVTKTVYNTAVSDITFTDVYGNTNGADNVSSATNKISVTYPSGMKNDEFNGKFILNDGTADISGTGAYDAETGVYTFTADKLLGAGKTYTLTLKDSTAQNGSVYKEIVGTFTTGDAVKDISLTDVKKTETGASVSVNAVNTGDAVTYYLITAGYKNDALAKCVIEQITVDSAFKDYTKTFDYTDEALAACDSVKAFMWNDISLTLTPVE